MDNPSGLTARQHWTWWRPVLTGCPEDQVGIYVQWKYFNRDVIKKALIEVNQITDLEVAVIEHGGSGRGVGNGANLSTVHRPSGLAMRSLQAVQVSSGRIIGVVFSGLNFEI